MPTINLPDDELAAVMEAIRRTIEDDRFPHAPRLDPLRAALARLDAAQSQPWSQGRTAGKGRQARSRIACLLQASVGQVDCLVRADIDIGRIRRLPVGVFTAQIHATIVALRYFSRRPLAGFQRA